MSKDRNKHETLEDEVILITSTVFCGLISLLILLLSIHHIKVFRENMYIPLSIKFLTHLINLLALTAAISLLSFVAYPLLTDDTIKSPTNTLFHVLALFCSNAILQPGSHLIYVLRLKHIFQNSIYQISNCFFILLLTSFSGFVISTMYLLYYVFLRGYPEGRPKDIDRKSLHHGMERGNQLALSTSIIMYIILVFLFTYKLFKLISITKSTLDYSSAPTFNYNEIEMSSHTKSDDSWNNRSKNGVATAKSALIRMPPKDLFNERQETLMYIVTRTTVLLTISTIASIVLNGFFLMQQIFFESWATFTIINRDYQCLYCLIEIFCLWLNYRSNDMIYSKLCSSCNTCCYRCCKWINWCTIKSSSVSSPKIKTIPIRNAEEQSSNSQPPL